MGLTIIKSKLSNISNDFDLRLDSKFYQKISESDFLLIEKTKYEFIELRHILIPVFEDFSFEEGKKYKGLLTDATFFENGEVVDYIEITKNNHPSRIRYSAKSGNIVISSLKGAKVSTILVTQDKEDYVWSNGFYIFENNGDYFETEYLYNLLKSDLLRKTLDENLSRGIGISSYYDRDLLRIKIPLIPKDKQIETTEKIENMEKKIKEISSTIPDVQELIENVFEKNLRLSPIAELIKNKKTEIFSTNLSNVGKRLTLRIDPKYFLFWNKTFGKLFVSNGLKEVKLRNLIKLYKPKILKKGKLEREYLLVDKEDIEPKKGIILNENKITRIDSDKIVFGGCDILIPKLRPYLGGTFLNEKDKFIIGTPEFLPYFVNTDVLLTEYLKYILLSDNYLNLVIYLHSGKEHPRINSYDLESIKVPLPDISVQEEIVGLINKSLGDLKEKIVQIHNYKCEIEKTVVESLA